MDKDKLKLHAAAPCSPAREVRTQFKIICTKERFLGPRHSHMLWIRLTESRGWDRLAANVNASTSSPSQAYPSLTYAACQVTRAPESITANAISHHEPVYGGHATTSVEEGTEWRPGLHDHRSSRRPCRYSSMHGEAAPLRHRAASPAPQPDHLRDMIPAQDKNCRSQ